MKLQLQNSWREKDDDRWNWSAYLTGPDVDKVDYVEYVLHPTFVDPVRKVKAGAQNGFKMETEGWGSFELKAIVHLKNGENQFLTHEIKLERGEGRTDVA